MKRKKEYVLCCGFISVLGRDLEMLLLHIFIKERFLKNFTPWNGKVYCINLSKKGQPYKKLTGPILKDSADLKVVRLKGEIYLFLTEKGLSDIRIRFGNSLEGTEVLKEDIRKFQKKNAGKRNGNRSEKR